MSSMYFEETEQGGSKMICDHLYWPGNWFILHVTASLVITIATNLWERDRNILPCKKGKQNGSKQ